MSGNVRAILNGLRDEIVAGDSISVDLATAMRGFLDYVNQEKDGKPANAKLKRRRVDLFVRGTRESMAKGATLNSDAFSLHRDVASPLAMLIDAIEGVPANKRKDLVKLCVELVKSAKGSQLDEYQGKGAPHRTPWQCVLARFHAPGVDKYDIAPLYEAMRYRVYYGFYDKKFLPHRVIDELKSCITETGDLKKQLPIYLVDQLSYLPGNVIPALEYLQSQSSELSVQVLIFLILPRLSSALMAHRTYFPTDPALHPIDTALRRLAAKLSLSEARPTITWKLSGEAAFKRALIDTDYRLPPGAFPVLLVRMIPERLNEIVYDALFMLSRLHATFSGFNIAKMATLAERYYSAIFRHPNFNGVMKSEGVPYAGASLLSVHGGFLPILTSLFTSLLEREYSDVQVANFVKVAIAMSIASNNVRTYSYFMTEPACKIIQDVKTNIVLLDDLLKHHPYNFDVLFEVMNFIAHRDMPLFLERMQSAPFDNPVYMRSYLKVTFQYIAHQIKSGMAGEYSAEYIRWHMTRMLPFIDEHRLLEWFDYAKTRFGDAFALEPEALTWFLQSYAADPALHAPANTVLCMVRVLMKRGQVPMNLPDFPLLDDVMPEQMIKKEIEGALLRDRLAHRDAQLKELQTNFVAMKKDNQQLRKEIKRLTTESEKAKAALVKAQAAFTEKLVACEKTLLAQLNKVSKAVIKRVDALKGKVLVATEEIAKKREASVEASSESVGSASSPLPEVVGVAHAEMACQTDRVRLTPSKRRLKDQVVGLKGLAMRQQMQIDSLMWNNNSMGEQIKFMKAQIAE